MSQLISQLNLAKAKLTGLIEPDLKWPPPEERDALLEVIEILNGIMAPTDGELHCGKCGEIFQNAEAKANHIAERHAAKDGGCPSCPHCGQAPAAFNMAQAPVQSADGSTLLIGQFWCNNPECSALFATQVLGVIAKRPGPENDLGQDGKRKLIV